MADDVTLREYLAALSDFVAHGGDLWGVVEVERYFGVEL